MKRLIVLSLTVTLLALQSGCSILNPQVADPCDTTSPLRSGLGQLRLRNLLPWRHDSSEECLECNEGFSEIGYDGQMLDGQVIDGQVYDGQVFDGQVIDSGYVDGFSESGYASQYGSPVVSSESLYHPEFVGPIVEAPSIPTRHVSQPEQIATPKPFE